jgi:hypothetical protein
MASQADRVPLIERIDRFQRAHREYVIGAPWATRSGLWEVSVRGQEGTASYDNGRRMMDALEVRAPRAEGRRG